MDLVQLVSNMKFILIFMLLRGGHITSIEFNSEKDCVAAGRKIQYELLPYSTRFLCIQK